ncbi:MAG: hypothetical protein ABIQ30_18270 [Devosia sp.]
MSALRPLIGAALLVFAFALPSLAATYVGGDSLGVGVGMAGKAPSVADESVRIKSKLPLKQIASVPKGSTLFMSLGTNDAVGGVMSVDAAVSDIITAATARDIKLVWLGPPCVFKNWDDDAEALDGKLSGLMSAQNVTYVSMRGDDLCSKSVRAKDGVHFTMKGYRLMWDRAVAASGGIVEIVPDTPVATSSKTKAIRLAVAPFPMPMPAYRRGGMSFGAPFPMPAPRFRLAQF